MVHSMADDSSVFRWDAIRHHQWWTLYNRRAHRLLAGHNHILELSSNIRAAEARAERLVFFSKKILVFVKKNF